MPRIQAPQTDDMSGEQRRIHDLIASGPRGGVRGPLAIWLHRPDLADKAQSLGRYCRYDSSLSPRLSELAIMTTARIWEAAYEWQTHLPHALEAGLSPAIIDALLQDKTPVFTQEDEEIVYLFTCELYRDRSVSDGLFDRAIACLGRDAVVDLVGVLGYYSLISMTIKAFEVAPAAG